ncbi:adenylate kinase [Pelomyxa schiedti]|nr:adenylate kinase [Pelomyxa schiedti]
MSASSSASKGGRRKGGARAPPNVLITGTPGTGKTRLGEALVTALSGAEGGAVTVTVRHVCVSTLVKEKGLHDGYDAEFDAYTLDEDKVCDELEPIMARGGVLLEAHSCDYFPKRWFQLVVCLQASTEVLYDRLQQRGYGKKKIDENMESEIMQVCLDEAQESYDEVTTLQSNTPEDHDHNVATIAEWIRNYMST